MTREEIINLDINEFEYGLPPRARNCLTRYNIHTLKELEEWSKDHKLSDMYSVGYVTISYIYRLAKHYGIKMNPYDTKKISTNIEKTIFPFEVSDFTPPQEIDTPIDISREEFLKLTVDQLPIPVKYAILGLAMFSNSICENLGDLNKYDGVLYDDVSLHGTNWLPLDWLAYIVKWCDHYGIHLSDKDHEIAKTYEHYDYMYIDKSYNVTN